MKTIHGNDASTREMGSSDGSDAAADDTCEEGEGDEADDNKKENEAQAEDEEGED